MLPGLADSHLKGPIVRGLIRRGMDVVRAQDCGLCGQADDVILAAATSEGRLMLTNDQDYLVLAAAWRAVGRDHAGIVYWHQDKYPIGEAIKRILDYAQNTSPAAAANVVHHL